MPSHLSRSYLPAHPALVRRFERFSQSASILTCLVGLFGLVGWGFDLPALKSVHPKLLSMKPNTALCFVLSGAALWWAQPKRANQRSRLRQGCALMVTLISALTLLEYLLAADFGIDQRLFHEAPGTVLTTAPGRMTPLSAIMFLLAGPGLLLVETETSRKVRPAQIFGLLGAVLGLLGLFSYLYGAFVFLGFTLACAAIPLLSVVAALALFAGLLAARPDRGLMVLLTSSGPGGVVARRLLVAVLCLPVALDCLLMLPQKAGAYGPVTEAALQNLLLIPIFAAFVYWVSWSLEQAQAERRAALEALRASEARYRLLFENSPQPMWAYDVHTLAILAVNDAAIQHYGYSRTEFLALTIKDLRPPEEVPVLLQFVSQLASPKSTNTLWRHRKKDGTLIWVQVFSHAMALDGREARLVIASDVTERKQMEAQLAYHAHLLANVHDAIIAIDNQFTIRAWNQAAAQLYGLEEKRAQGQNIARVVGAQLTESQLSKTLQGLIQTGYARVEALHQNKTDQVFQAEVTISRLPAAEPQYTGYVAVIRDVTERKKAEAEREMLLQSLQEALANVKTLSGLLPICAGCKKIRDDRGYWNQIEAYLLRHSDARFTHGMCPECIKQYYPELAEPLIGKLSA